MLSLQNIIISIATDTSPNATLASLSQRGNEKNVGKKEQSFMWNGYLVLTKSIQFSPSPPLTYKKGNHTLEKNEVIFMSPSLTNIFLGISILVRTSLSCWAQIVNVPISQASTPSGRVTVISTSVKRLIIRLPGNLMI